MEHDWRLHLIDSRRAVLAGISFVVNEVSWRMMSFYMQSLVGSRGGHCNAVDAQAPKGLMSTLTVIAPVQ